MRSLQIPAPPHKPLEFTLERKRIIDQSVGPTDSALWRGVLDRTFGQFGWQAGWQGK
jgi:hypothetical protein